MNTDIGKTASHFVLFLVIWNKLLEIQLCKLCKYKYIININLTAFTFEKYLKLQFSKTILHENAPDLSVFGPDLVHFQPDLVHCHK